jgi:hypothetical protein
MDRRQRIRRLGEGVARTKWLITPSAPAIPPSSSSILPLARARIELLPLRSKVGPRSCRYRTEGWESEGKCHDR